MSSMALSQQDASTSQQSSGGDGGSSEPTETIANHQQGLQKTRKCELDRLLEKQLEEIDQVGNKIQLWTKYRNDYQDLKQLINQMQEKVRHPHRIPIAGSRMAFVRGHIIHTNELTVLLGDNYFALRSAKQASQIVDRRLNDIGDKLKKSQEAKRKTEDWLKFCEEHKRDKEELVEIIETM